MLKEINLPTSVAAKDAELAVIVTDPVVPDGEIVVADVFCANYGPSVKSTSVNVQAV